MGLVEKTPRWALYKCFSCRHVMGKINNELKGPEFKDATAEMDAHAQSIMHDELRDRLQHMSPDELDDFFGGKDKLS
jgi:hypothetical protein